MCSLRLQFADLFHNLQLAHKITVNQTGAFYFSQACSEDVFNFLQKQTNDSYCFISELMDFFLWLVFTSNLNSQITWLRSSFNSSTCGTAARAEAARATTPQADSIDADKEEGNRDTPDTGPWRSIKTRKPPIACLWTGSQTCVRSGGWLVEVASQQALLFLISPVVILCCDLALACS